MRRLLTIIVTAALVAPVLSGCSREVKVQTGTRYLCVYGEQLGDEVKTIEVPAAEAGKYKVETKTILCSKHKHAEDLYLKAQAAIRSGDLKAARAALSQVVKLDPQFRHAPQQISAIDGGRKPDVDTDVAQTPGGGNNSGGTPPPSQNTTGTKKPPAGDVPSPAMDAFRDMVPDELAGFTAEPLTAESLTLSRTYVPADKSRFDQLAIMVQQCQTAEAAKRTRDTDIKPSYPASSETVSVSGLPGYFGTNGQGFAALSLVNGSALVTLELHATGGTKAASLKAELERIAETILD